MTSYVSETIKWLDEHPDEWEYDLGRHRLVHRPSGAAVWIANWFYGVHIEIYNRTLWGGVGVLSSFGLSVPHWRLWRAYRRWQKRRNPAASLFTQGIEARSAEQGTLHD